MSSIEPRQASPDDLRLLHLAAKMSGFITPAGADILLGHIAWLEQERLGLEPIRRRVPSRRTAVWDQLDRYFANELTDAESDAVLAEVAALWGQEEQLRAMERAIALMGENDALRAELATLRAGRAAVEGHLCGGGE